MGIPTKYGAQADKCQDKGGRWGKRLKTNKADAESLTAEVWGGDVESVCVDSLWDCESPLRWCVREALKPLLLPLLLLTVRARGSTECGGGEETRKGRGGG